jgi:uncharacterized protein YozE (UPF0346 family)
MKRAARRWTISICWKRYIQIRPKKDIYKYSFFPRTIRDWNQLSDELLDIESSEEFKSRLTKLYYGGWTTWTKDDDFVCSVFIVCITSRLSCEPIASWFTHKHVWPVLHTMYVIYLSIYLWCWLEKDRWPITKDIYKYSFFPRTIRDWNQLSDELLDIESSEEFKSRLTKLYNGGCFFPNVTAENPPPTKRN